MPTKFEAVNAVVGVIARSTVPLTVCVAGESDAAGAAATAMDTVAVAVPDVAPVPSMV